MGLVPEVPKEIADRLYTVAPEQFTAARTAAAATAKADGDPGLAKAIGALRKPTAAAWLINRLALTHPDQITRLDTLAEQFRAAQQGLHGDDLRRLATERKAIVADLVQQLRSTATLSSTAGAEVEATFLAAVADEEVAALVRTGRLLKTTAFSGFGVAPLTPAQPVSKSTGVAVVSPTKAATPVDLREAAAAERAAAESELADARTAHEAAQSEVDLAAEAEELGTVRLAQADEALAEARARQAAVKEELHQLRLAHTTAQRALVTAGRRLDRTSLS